MRVCLGGLDQEAGSQVGASSVSAERGGDDGRPDETPRGILLGMPSTTIKVPVELHRRLAARATEGGTTLAAVVEKGLDQLEEAEFWRSMERTMPKAPVAEDRAILESTLKDGLDATESWEDLW